MKETGQITLWDTEFVFVFDKENIFLYLKIKKISKK